MASLSVVAAKELVTTAFALAVAGPGAGVGHSLIRVRLKRSALPLVHGQPGLMNRRGH